MHISPLYSQSPIDGKVKTKKIFQKTVQRYIKICESRISISCSATITDFTKLICFLADRTATQHDRLLA